MTRKTYGTGGKSPVILRILSVLLVCVMMVSVGSVAALADETGESQEESYSEESSETSENSETSGDENSESGGTEDSGSSESSSSEGSSQAEATPSPTPEPVTVPQPNESFYVYDEANVISDATEQTIVAKNQELNEKYGIQIVVMAVQSVGSASMRDYTAAVFQNWKIGGENGNGLLLVLDIEGDTYHTVSGAGLGSVFTNEVLKTLVDEQLEPDFNAKNYDSGVSKFFASAVTSVEEYAAANPGLITEKEQKKEENGFLVFLKWVGILLLVVVLLLAVLIVVVYIRGQMVRKKRMEQRRRRAQQSRGPSPQRSSRPARSSGRLPDNLSGGYRSSSSDKYDFDDFKPRK